MTPEDYDSTHDEFLMDHARHRAMTPEPTDTALWSVVERVVLDTCTCVKGRIGLCASCMDGLRRGVHPNTPGGAP